MKREYSDATTKRYIKWLAVRAVDGNAARPTLREIETWLRNEEQYRDPLRAVMQLCVGLREMDDAMEVQWIASELARALEDEREFSGKVGTFFDAMVRRFKVEDFDVVCYDQQHRRLGSLHALREEAANAND